MEKLLEQFARVPMQQKVAALVGIIAVICGGFYFVFISDNLDLIEVNEAKLGDQERELFKLQQQAQHRTQFMREVERLKQRLAEAEEQLPKQAEIPKLLRDIAYEAQQSGLRMDRFELQPEAQQGDFAAVPVKMSVRGSYHEIAVFLDRLSKMPRIVNVTDLTMTTPRMENKKIVVGSSYTATTYRFLDRPAAAEGAKPADKSKPTVGSSDDNG
jgi:type IV pilus assembly protein PilO